MFDLIYFIYFALVMISHDVVHITMRCGDDGGNQYVLLGYSDVFINEQPSA